MFVNLDAIHLQVLGAAVFIEISDTESQPSRISVNRADDSLLRALAAHPDGVRADQVHDYLPFLKLRAVYDSANRLRAVLKPLSLRLTGGRPGYRIHTISGKAVRIESDLSALSACGSFVQGLQEQQWAEGEPPVTTLVGDLQQLDAIVASWPESGGRSGRVGYSERMAVLGALDDIDRHRRLIDLENDVRLERARRSLSLARQTKGVPRLESAKRAVADVDAAGEDFDGHRARLKQEVGALERVLGEVVEADTDVFLAAPMEEAENYTHGRS